MMFYMISASRSFSLPNAAIPTLPLPEPSISQISESSLVILSPERILTQLAREIATPWVKKCCNSNNSEMSPSAEYCKDKKDGVLAYVCYPRHSGR